MAPAEITALLQTKPFVPFRILTTEGVTYNVYHPDLVMVGINSIIVGTPTEDNPTVYSGAHMISLYHVLRIEMITPSQPVSP